jgi:V/A-type H+-transporting ATPase subunit E
MSQLTEKLEGLLQAQAMDLAQRHLERGRQVSEQILAKTRAKLHQLEEGEERRFQLEAEHLCRQILQSARLRRDAELDRLRWTLAQDVLGAVSQRLKDFIDQPEGYRAVLAGYLAEAAQHIPDRSLLVELVPRDIELLRPHWDAWVNQAASGREVRLAALSDPVSGGMRVSNEDGTQRVDNTFEGRLARMEEEILGAIMDALFSPRIDGKDEGS